MTVREPASPRQKEAEDCPLLLAAGLECPLLNCLPGKIRSYCNGNTAVVQVAIAVALYRTTASAKEQK